MQPSGVPFSGVRLSGAWLKVAGASLALVMAAALGARWQVAQQPAPLPVDPAVQRAMLADAAVLQDQIADLAGRVGELQGRILAMESLGTQVADAAGLHYTAPELAAGLFPDVGALPARSGAAEQLGHRIDRLSARLAQQQDRFTLVAAVQSRQAGRQAALPTLSPVAYPFQSSSFGWRRNPVSGRSAMHEGLDFAAPRGTAIRAASGGVVVRAGRVPGYGRMVEIDHGGGLRTRYAHASRVLVQAGDVVRQGDLVGRVGSTGRSTGSHLHFEVRVADYPLDPTLFLRQASPASALQNTARLTDASRGHHAGG